MSWTIEQKSQTLVHKTARFCVRADYGWTPYLTHFMTVIHSILAAILLFELSKESVNEHKFCKYIFSSSWFLLSRDHLAQSKTTVRLRPDGPVSGYNNGLYNYKNDRSRNSNPWKSCVFTRVIQYIQSHEWWVPPYTFSWWDIRVSWWSTNLTVSKSFLDSV